MRSLRNYWLIDHAHVAFQTAFLVTLLTSYIVLHLSIRDAYLGLPEVAQSIREAVRLYQLAEDSENGELALYIDGIPLDQSSDDAGPLGIGRSTSARGFLSETQTIIDQANQRLSGFVAEIIARFQPVISQATIFEAPVDLFEPVLAGGTNQVIRIRVEDPGDFYGIAPNSAGARKLFRLLATAQTFEPRARSGDPDLASIIESIDSSEAVSDEIRESLARIGSAAGGRSPVGGTVYVAVDQPSRQEILESFCGGMRAAREPLRRYFSGEGTLLNDEESSVAFGECAVTLYESSSANSSPAEDSFHQRLQNIVMNEIDFFWVFGPFRWAEIFMLTWLGVLTEGLVRLANQYAGRDPDRALWEPRETVRTATKFVYAPILSVIVIFTIMMTNIFEADVAIARGGIAWFVPVAFVLGLFPNLGYSMLAKIANWFFKSTTMASKRREPKPQQRTAIGTMPVAPDRSPSFDTMKTKIKTAVIAPVTD